jgi:hypothetical protein
MRASDAKWFSFGLMVSLSNQEAGCHALIVIAALRIAAMRPA